MEELKQAAQTAENTAADNAAEEEKKLSPDELRELIREKMEEGRKRAAEITAADNAAEEEKKLSPDELRELIREKMEEGRQKAKEAQEAMAQGKGKLTLETPMKSGEKEITELKYDFTAMTGLEYTDALDNDMNANPNAIQNITHKQALALFAKAAAKQTEGLDMQDIMTRIGATDALEAVQLAKIFFVGSTRAGRMRISKM